MIYHSRHRHSWCVVQQQQQQQQRRPGWVQERKTVEDGCRYGFWKREKVGDRMTLFNYWRTSVMVAMNRNNTCVCVFECVCRERETGESIGHISYWMNGNVAVSSFECSSAEMGLHSSLEETSAVQLRWNEYRCEVHTLGREENSSNLLILPCAGRETDVFLDYVQCVVYRSIDRAAVNKPSSPRAAASNILSMSRWFSGRGQSPLMTTAFDGRHNLEAARPEMSRVTSTDWDLPGLFESRRRMDASVAERMASIL